MRFGSRLLFSDLTVNVKPGRTLAVLGPNGRGKTTVLRSILGTNRLTSGSRIAPAVIGYVPQSAGFTQGYCARDVVLMGRAGHLGVFGQPTGEDRSIADRSLADVGMAHLADARIDLLSGGERQMVLLARALATGSKALLLDEPGSALDLKNQSRLLQLLRRLGERNDMAILFTTHEPNHALVAADDVLLMMPDGDCISGPVEHVLTADALERLYGVPMVSMAAPQTPRGYAVAPVFC